MEKPHLAAMRRRLAAAAEELPPDVALRFRAMFGGIGVYGRDRMFASLSDAGLALKLSPSDRLSLLGEEGARPLRYEAGGPVSKEYVVVPPQIVEETCSLAGWVPRSIDHASAAPIPKRQRSPRREGS